jgi:hypothetical protein
MTQPSKETYGYIAIYNGRRCEVRADTALEAQAKAARIFKARQMHKVDVHLVEDEAGNQVTTTITS